MTATADRPWLSSYAEGVPAEVEVPQESLVDLLSGAAGRFGAKVALDFYGATTTYAELDGLVSRAASALEGLGVGRGDRVALVLPNCPQHVVAFYAALRLGAVVVEHNPLYTPKELEQQLADSGARVAVVWDKSARAVRWSQARTSVETVVSVDLTRALPRLKRLALRLPLPSARSTREAMTAEAPDTLSWDSLVSGAQPLAASHPGPAPTDTALLQYTGGTTGAPKGAVLSHANLRANAAQGRAWVPGLVDGEETIYAVLPLFHAYGLTLCLTFAVSIGATLVLFPRFDADQVLDASRRRPPTFLPAVPPVYDKLAGRAQERGVDLGSIRYGISGAMSLPTRVVDTWEQVTGGYLVEGYGMTETSPITIGNPVSEARRPGTVGVPFPSTEIRVVDPEDTTVDRAQGEAGELLVRGPQVFSGYWNRPEETEAVLLPDGWLRTGDIVTVSEDGFVTIVDRIKELIITGGFNVYPSEVEDALRQVPGVEDAAAVGLRTADGAEEVAAAVVLTEGSDTSPEDVRTSCRQHLAGYKVPRHVVVVDDLPRSMIGKVLRREVRDLLEERGDKP